MNVVNPAEFSDTSSVISNLKNQSPEKKLDINEISIPPKLKKKGDQRGQKQQ